MTNEKNPYCSCLFYSANALSRLLTKMADDAFASVRMSPSHGFLLMAVNRTPGIQPGEIARQLMLTPSTITRLIEKLERMGLVERKNEGKMTHVFTTAAGKKLQPDLMRAWHHLYEQYIAILGKTLARKMTEEVFQAAVRLERSF